MRAPPDAFAVHRTRRRARLRIPERRGDAAFFAELEGALRAAPGVVEVRADPRTAGVLVRHDGDLDEIASHAMRSGLVTWRERGDRDVLAELGERIRATDAELHARTQGRWSLDSITFFALLGAGLWQIAGGSILPAGVTLLTKAFSMVEQREDDTTD
ncbi:hypothetical protein [Sandaracinus amylolyticus]|uniref:hypothetical protein n=1 Tax=Sandaracinus amylolyticus TaxID=927083 RepID=UPI001F2522E3|nr:hypothetical protein [Sandaracinus amylolyticus]UJR86362.1 Hypothetical protein I5071_84560 [Sandaracinus amylolyticus]